MPQGAELSVFLQLLGQLCETMFFPNGRCKFISVCVLGIVLVGWIATFNYEGSIVIFVNLGDIHIHHVDNQIRFGTGDVCFANWRRIDLHDWFYMIR